MWSRWCAGEQFQVLRAREEMGSFGLVQHQQPSRQRATAAGGYFAHGGLRQLAWTDKLAK